MQRLQNSHFMAEFSGVGNLVLLKDNNSGVVESFKEKFPEWELQSFEFTELETVGGQIVSELSKEIDDPDIIYYQPLKHGFFKENTIGKITYSNNPLFRSGILLSGAAQTLLDGTQLRRSAESGQEDGILTAFEAMNLNVNNTELVVLSACETGLGEIRNGEGVYGLQRAFMVAGAQTIIMSLFEVSDEATQKLMGYFYDNWINKNMDKRKAFVEAKKKLRNEIKFAEPKFWGAFIMVGE